MSWISNRWDRNPIPIWHEFVTNIRDSILTILGFYQTKYARIVSLHDFPNSIEGVDVVNIFAIPTNDIKSNHNKTKIIEIKNKT